MKSLKLAALALALATPGIASAATDGTLGTTSTGSFNASLQVNAPAGTQVQVLGLDDFTFPAVTGGITTNTPVPAIEQPFCLSRSTPGNVLVTISQTGNAGSYNLNDGAGHTLSLSMVVTSPAGSGGSATGTSNGGAFAAPPSNAGCTAASNNTVAHTLRLSPGTVLSQTGGQAYGNFSGAFTVLVSAQ
jgi:hypothetical protein